MKRYFLLFFLTVYSLTATYAQQSSSGKVITDLEPVAFQKAIQTQPVTLLDVRTPQEYTKGHLTNSRNLDIFNDNFKEELTKLDKTKPYYVYCHSGGRSMEAAELMQEMGFTKVYNMTGGITAWKEAGLPVVQAKK
jgi:rhodanese-related sulfurtransferase